MRGDPGPPPDTARLALRPFTADDAHALFELDADTRVMRYINGGTPGTRAGAHLAIERILRRYVEHPGTGVWHVTRKDDGRFAGWISLKHAGDSPDIEVGYRLMHHAWGQGFATELAQAMLRRGFGQLRLDRIIGVTDPDNVASQRVLVKVGMRDEGRGRYYGEDLRLFAAYRAQR